MLFFFFYFFKYKIIYIIWTFSKNEVPEVVQMSGPLLCNLQYTIRIMHPNVEELVQLDFQTGPRYYRNKQLSKHKYWSESEKMTIQQYLKLFKQLSFLLNTSRTKFGFLIQQRSTCIHSLVAFAEKIYIYTHWCSLTIKIIKDLSKVNGRFKRITYFPRQGLHHQLLLEQKFQ